MHNELKPTNTKGMSLVIRLLRCNADTSNTGAQIRLPEHVQSNGYFQTFQLACSRQTPQVVITCLVGGVYKLWHGVVAVLVVCDRVLLQFVCTSLKNSCKQWLLRTGMAVTGTEWRIWQCDTHIGSSEVDVSGTGWWLLWTSRRQWMLSLQLYYSVDTVTMLITTYSKYWACCI